MGVLEGDSAVYVLKIESRHTIRMFSRVGRRIPLYCTAIGKVLLAFAREDEREPALKGVRQLAFTQKTLTTRTALYAELERIRQQGFALDDEEHEEGIHCIAAPVFDHTGSVVAAISASWPGFRYGREEEGSQGRPGQARRGADLRPAGLPGMTDKGQPFWINDPKLPGRSDPLEKMDR